VLKISRIVPLGLAAPVLAAVMSALAPLNASATVACRVLTMGTAAQGVGTETCNNPPGVTAPQNLREAGDGSETTPVSTNFPTSVLVVNTKSKLRYSVTIGGVGFGNEIPDGYAAFGVKLERDPVSATKACRVATGAIPWFGASNGKPTAMFAGTGAWTFSVDSNSTACAEGGKVTIGNVSMLLEKIGPGGSPILVAGTLEGRYSQPRETGCLAGGIELNVDQPGITTEPATERFEIDNGEAKVPVFLCFVGASNYVFPTTAPTWAPFTNTTEKANIGIWKD
jgi:hypothetical protein